MKEHTAVIPEELKYTEEHEWVLRTGEDTVRVGITDYAQEQLGDVVFVQLPELGEQVAAGQTLGEVESTKSVSDIYAPLAGEVVARNDSLDQQPDLVNSDPYGEGWMVELRLEDPTAVDDLLDAAAYQELVAGE
ncbi:glycine cleavage system protein H [Saccharothrix sp. CB00851]|nr:glycine cleavage system protein H [Saccharothrix sp. CB00851]